MNKPLRFILFFFFILSGVTSYGQTLNWELTHGPYGAPISCIAKLKNILISVSSYNGIFRSFDSGKSWLRISTLPYAQMIAATNSALIIGGSQGVYRSLDSGHTWEQTIPDQTAKYCSGMGANDSSLFVINTHGVFRSMDSGTTWERINSKWSPVAITVQGSLIYIIVNPDSINYLFGGVYRSTDNGNSWDQMDTMFSKRRVLALASTGASVFASINNKSLYRSDDSGKTWITLSPGFPFRINHFFPDGQFIYASLSGPGLYRSSDNGSSWNLLQSGLENDGVSQLVRIDSMLVAGSSTIFRSNDNGNTFLNSDSGITGISAKQLLSNGKTLFAVTDYKVFSSQDKGNRWSQLPGVPQGEIYFLAQRDSVLFLGGEAKNITDVELLYRSYNGGTKWDSCSMLGAGSFSTNNKILLAGGGFSSGLISSTDDGNNWNFLLPAQSSYNRVTDFVLSDSLIIADIDSEGKRFDLISVDNGNTWSSFDLPDSLYAFAAAGNVIFSQNNSGIYRSDNKSLSWEKIKGLSSIKAIIGDTLFGLSTDKKILISVDRGIHWVSTRGVGLPSYDLTDISIYNGEVFASLYSGGIYRTTFPAISKVETSEKQIEQSLAIHPNPSTESFVVSYSLMSQEKISMDIFDALGRVVLLPLSNVLQENGNHEISINTKSLSPGIYSCRLTIGAKEEVIKLVVVH
jgi:photosystem II stability/assembly factor-like uncharacterized protein